MTSTDPNHKPDPAGGPAPARRPDPTEAEVPSGHAGAAGSASPTGSGGPTDRDATTGHKPATRRRATTDGDATTGGGGSTGGIEPATDLDPMASALSYLREQLGSRAPAAIEEVARFGGEPLEGEGDMVVYRFEAALDSDQQGAFFVVAGQTEPNYYPVWDLSAEAVYELHLGTRFMLVMEVPQVTVEDPDGKIRAWFEAFLTGVTPGETVAVESPAVGFQIEDATTVVARASVAGEPVWVVGYEGPPGIYREVHLPPHVILRRHLGLLIRREADEEARRARMAQVRRQALRRPR